MQAYPINTGLSQQVFELKLCCRSSDLTSAALQSHRRDRHASWALNPLA